MMECENCGGRFEWRGWHCGNFTHTECMACGGRNCQRLEPAEEEEAVSHNPTMGEWLHPHEGSMVEFWRRGMTRQGQSGTGIRGWFRDGQFLPGNNGDRHAPSEVTHWVGLRNAMQCAARGCDGCLVCEPRTDAPQAA